MWLHLVVLFMTTSLSFGASLKTTGYVTYYPGTLPIVLAAPHGGSLRPDEIPDRDAGCYISDACVWSHTCGTKDESRCRATTVKDLNTKELTLLMREELFALYGKYPHVVINELHRVKLDANREMYQAAFGVPIVDQAWTEFHDYIEQSKTASSVPSLFLDIHGHGHALQWVELGYLISGSNLDSGNFVSTTTSIRELAERVDISFEDLLRGQDSFGDILEQEGYESVPSPDKPGPNGNSYFSGGTNTRMHGSIAGGETDAIQIESPSSFRSAEMREAYAKALARTIKKYMELHFGFRGTGSPKMTTPRMDASRNSSSDSKRNICSIITLLMLLCQFAIKRSTC